MKELAADRAQTLLLAGGGYADIPLIQAARRLGYMVLSTGNRADDAGHAHSDRYVPGDFSDAEDMLAIAREYDIDAICPNCNDFSALSSAYVAEALGLPGHDTFEVSTLIHHKDRFRDYAQRQGLPCPTAQGYSNCAQAMEETGIGSGLVMVKPVDLTGGKGIAKVRRGQEAKAAVSAAFEISRSKRIVVEDYVEGSNHGFSCMIRDGRVVFYFVDDEYYYINPFLVSAAASPGRVPDNAVRRLVEICEFMADDLRLVDGIFHVQFILTGKEPVIIEICRRPPGDLYVDLVRHATKVDYPTWIVRGFTGMGLKGLDFVKPFRAVGRHCIMAERAGEVVDVIIDPQVADLVIDQMTWWAPGDSINDPLVEKLGIVFLAFDSPEAMWPLMDVMQERIKVNLAP